MKSDIYYFSATGNSLTVGRKISEALNDSQLYSIPEIIHGKDEIKGETIGIVSPIYMYDMPWIVKDFVRKISQADYIFFVFTGAGELGKGDRETFRLFTSENLTLSALFNVAMPSNYTPYGCPSEEKQASLFAEAEKKIASIVAIVNERKEHRDDNNTSFFKTHIHPGIFYRMGYKRLNTLDASFSVDEKCNGCGICARVCPVENITIEEEKPRWHHNCQFCYGCLQWCPRESIQHGKATGSIKRYHHPEVTVKDFVKRK